MTDKELIEKITYDLECIVSLNDEVQDEGKECVSKRELDKSQAEANLAEKLLSQIWSHQIKRQKLMSRMR